MPYSVSDGVCLDSGSISILCALCQTIVSIMKARNMIAAVVPVKLMREKIELNETDCTEMESIQYVPRKKCRNASGSYNEHAPCFPQIVSQMRHVESITAP